MTVAAEAARGARPNPSHESDYDIYCQVTAIRPHGLERRAGYFVQRHCDGWKCLQAINDE